MGIPTYHIPPATYVFIPPTTYLFPFPTYHIPPTTYLPTTYFVLPKKHPHPPRDRLFVAGEEQPAGEQRIPLRAAAAGDQPHVLARRRQQRQGIGVAGVAVVVVFDAQGKSQLVGEEQVGVDRGGDDAVAQAGHD